MRRAPAPESQANSSRRIDDADDEEDVDEAADADAGEAWVSGDEAGPPKKRRRRRSRSRRTGDGSPSPAAPDGDA